jgi:hypothetical protein
MANNFSSILSSDHLAIETLSELLDGQVDQTANSLYANASIISIGNSSVYTYITPYDFTTSKVTIGTASSNVVIDPLSINLNYAGLNTSITPFNSTFSGLISAQGGLYVAGEIYLGRAIYANGVSGTVYIASDGKMGIGTTSPANKVHIVGPSLTQNSETTYGLWVSNTVTPSKALVLGYDTTNDAAQINAVHQGVAWKNILMQTNAGSVGIGTTSPSSYYSNKLVVGVSTEDGITIAGTGENYLMFADGTSGLDRYRGFIGYSHTINRLRFGTDAVERVCIISDGNVGINTPTPTAKLQVSGSTNVVNIIGSGSVASSSLFSVDGNSGRLFEITDDLSDSIFSANTIAGLPAIEAFSDYTVTLGQYSSAGSTLRVSGSNVLIYTGSLAVGNIVPSTTRGRIDATNDIVAYSTSDKRFKINVTEIANAIGKINEIRGVEFDWLTNPEYHGNQGHDVGVIAQELEKVLPEVVTTRESGYKAVKYEKIIPLLIEGIKEQQKQIENLQKQIDYLSNK